MVAIECTGYDVKVTTELMDSMSVAMGQAVTAGQKIGGCGHTGNAEPKPGTAASPLAHTQLAVRDGNGWRNINPCSIEEGSNTPIFDCRKLMGPKTRRNEIHDVGGGPVASN